MRYILAERGGIDAVHGDATLRRLALALLLALCTAVPALAQTGKLAGVVTDDRGEPLPGVNVVFEGTTQGTASAANGYYVVLNVRPGTYIVVVSAIGFSTRRIENVRIASEQTTTLDVEMAEETFVGEEIVVRAERPVVDVSQTSQVAILQREEIALLPVQDVAGIVELQAGVVDGHFRGGRLGEVQYQVDGVTVNDPYTNQASLRLDRSLIQEVQVISGTFDAEYGQALSGVVNVVVRDGSPDEFEVNAETFFGDTVALGGEDDLCAIDADVCPIGSLDLGAQQNYQMNLSGPTGLPNTTFLVNGQRLTSDGFFYGQRVFSPTDSADVQTNAIAPTGDGAVVPLQTSREWSGLAKLTNTSIRGVRLSYQALYNRTRRQDGSYAFRLNPDGRNTQRQTSLVHGLDLSHTLTDRLFYTLSLRQNYVDYSDYAFEDWQDPRYFEAGPPRILGSVDGTDLEGTIVQGVDGGRFAQQTTAYLGKAAVTWQATPVHLLKAGLEVQASDLAFGVPGGVGLQSLDGSTFVPNDTLPEFQLNGYQPVQAAAYVQDRVEWRDLRVRFGVRAEYFDANATVPSDLQNPANSIVGAPESVPVETTAKVVIAPRLGVSFPITSRASLFFSWGHFYQTPGLGTFFNNADYSVLDNLQAGSISYGVLGNPDLDPEFTAQYEFGFKAALTRWLGVDVAIFYKDIRDLLGVEFIDTYTAATYSRLTNVDFGNVRGLTFSLDQRPLGESGGLSLATTLDYTLQLAQGNSSDPFETATRAAAGEDPRPRVVPFNWDQRHTINATAIVSQRGRFAITGIVQIGTGQPYTPQIGLPGFDSSLGTNAARKPLAARVDLRGEYFVTLGGTRLTAFARVFNLLDARFSNGFVFDTTGSPFYALNANTQFVQMNNPARFASPRRVEIGLSFRRIFDR